MAGRSTPQEAPIGASEGQSARRLLRNVQGGYLMTSLPVARERSSGQRPMGMSRSPSNAQRHVEMVRALRSYNLAANQSLGPGDLNQVVRDTLHLVADHLDGWSDDKVAAELAPDLPPLRCDLDWVAEVLLHLCSDAHTATPQDGEITVRSGYDGRTGRYLLQVSHVGESRPESQSSPIGDRASSGDWPARVTPRYSVAANVACAHGGEIEIERRPDDVTCVTLWLPEQIEEPRADRSPPDERDRDRPTPSNDARPRHRKRMSLQEAIRDDSDPYHLRSSGPVRAVPE